MLPLGPPSETQYTPQGLTGGLAPRSETHKQKQQQQESKLIGTMGYNDIMGMFLKLGVTAQTMWWDVEWFVQHNPV